MAEECHWNNTVGSYMVSFSGVADTFFTLRKPDITIFFSALLIAFSRGGWAVGMLLLSGAISPRITHARGASGTCRHRVEELNPLFAALRLSERMFPILSCLPPLCPQENAAVHLCSCFTPWEQDCSQSQGSFPDEAALGMGMTSVLQQVGGFECWWQGELRRGRNRLNCSIKSALHTRKLWCKSLFWGTWFIAVT